MLNKTSIKHTIFLAFAVMAAFACGAPQTSDDDSARRDLSYEELMEISAAARLNHAGDSAHERGDYLRAIALYQQSMDSAAVEGDSTLYYDSKLDIASVHYRLGEIDKAVSVAEVTTEAFLRSGDSSRIGRAYAALAGYYGKAGDSEKSLSASRIGFEFSKKYGSLIHQCAAYNQMAFVYSDAGKWAAAKPYLDTALHLMEQSGVLDQRAGMYLNIGNCYRNLGNWPEARRYLAKAEREADSLGHKHIYAKSLERLSQVAEATGNTAEALTLFKKSVALKDSIFKADKMRQTQELEASFELKEKEQEILLLQAEKQADAARRNFAFVASLFVLALLGFGLYSTRQKLSNAKRTLDQNKSELNEFAALLRVKNARLVAAELALEQSQHTPEPDGVPSESLEQETHSPPNTENLYNSQILTDADWEMFKKRFEGAFPGYLIKLRLKCPKLSNAEERFFLLIKLGFNSQEIADLLGITTNAVKKGRQRLRRRLELQPNEDLDEHILGIK